MRYDGMKTLLKQYMYKDRMTVSRQIADVDEEGADDYTMKDVYTDVPCHLGIYEISMTGRRIGQIRCSRGFGLTALPSMKSLPMTC